MATTSPPGLTTKTGLSILSKLRTARCEGGKKEKKKKNVLKIHQKHHIVIKRAVQYAAKEQTVVFGRLGVVIHCVSSSTMVGNNRGERTKPNTEDGQIQGNSMNGGRGGQRAVRSEVWSTRRGTVDVPVAK